MGADLIDIPSPDLAPDSSDVSAQAYQEFAGMVVPHLAVLRALARRYVGRDDADDVVQDALVRAWRSRATFDLTRGSAKGWLVTIVLNEARRLGRAKVPRWVARDRPVEGDVPGRLDVEAVVRRLPRRQREVVTLFYLADLPVEEVASILGISTGSVKSHLSEARKSLRMRLELS